MSKLESETTYLLNRRIIQNFMDIIILKHLKNNQPISGYDVIKYLHRKFHILPSSGTVYSILYSLERQNLIRGKMNNGKRVYALTDEGEKTLKSICTAKTNIQSLLAHIFSEA
jgi:DNA-binding PadR family transcriptional regulator